MEKVITVGIKTKAVNYKQLYNFLDELGRLVNTAGGEVFFNVIQNRAKFDPAFLIGAGKAREISQLARANKIRTIVFDEDLTPAQQRNLEELMELKIIDRTRLILDIFASRARTSEAGLQISLAQMNYFLPRLNQKGIWLDNQSGGIGTRGPGERKLEYDRRYLRDKISQLKKELEKVKMHRKVQRIQRKNEGIQTIALVGYTNSGKSTLLNKLTDLLMKSKEDAVYADNKLFATLDPTTRRLILESGKELLITDTVGFINKLPHQLVASFRSTLEEILEANCLMHIIDASNPDHISQEKVVFDTLKELGAGEIPMIKVYNKIDLIHPNCVDALKNDKNSLFISAKNGAGFDELLDKIDKVLYTQKTTGTVSINYNQPKLVDFVFSNTKILEKSYHGAEMKLKIQTDELTWNKIQKQLKNK
ncbi:MAG: GTPase HflX [Elusimicrobiota bacterium]